jgi:ribosomal-protein-alanine N-acetyltransferase
LRGERVVLRGWRESDLEPLLPMFAEHGFGWWAVDVPGVAPFVGFVGLQEPSFDAWFTPCVEVGWRLSREHWGHGYATEAARAALTHGFDVVGLDEIVSFTVPANVRSRAVMERLGMRYDGEFEHPRLAEGSPLRTHVLYRLPRP